MDDPQEPRLTALRALAHPVRLRILSLLTGAAMSAAEVARELNISHANASYHLRVLLASGDLVEAGEERIRGGVAKRYRYDVAAGLVDHKRDSTTEERLAEARATAVEWERRLLEAAPGSSMLSDLEAWVPVDSWHRALDLVHQASALLHEAALPPRSEQTVHISFISTAFTMTGGLTGRDVRWRP